MFRADVPRDFKYLDYTSARPFDLVLLKESSSLVSAVQATSGSVPIKTSRHALPPLWSSGQNSSSQSLTWFEMSWNLALTGDVNFWAKPALHTLLMRPVPHCQKWARHYEQLKQQPSPIVQAGLGCR